MPLSLLDIYNMALGECPAGSIASVSEKSQSAYECARVGPQVIGEMVEEFGYDFAITRAALAQVANDRSAEWSYAYAVPANMASPVRLLPNLGGATGTVPLLVGQTLAPVIGGSFGDPFRIPYDIADDVIYCGVAGAMLEYIRTDVDASRFPRLFVRAAGLEIAARIVMPLLKSRERQRELAQAAEVMKQRAMADNMNRKPTTTYGYVSDMELAREGFIG